MFKAYVEVPGKVWLILIVGVSLGWFSPNPALTSASLLILPILVFPLWLKGTSRAFLEKFPKEVILRQLFKRINHFLYIGGANRRLYEKYGVPKERLHPAPYCVDNDRFAKQATELLPKRSEIRREWKIPEEAFCILFAGKFIPKKRPLDLVQAVCKGRFNRATRPIHLLFAGSGELGEKLRKSCHVVFDAETLHKSSPSLNLGHKESRSDLSLTYFLVGDKRPSASFVGFLNQTEISKAYIAADCLVLRAMPAVRVKI